MHDKKNNKRPPKKDDNVNTTAELAKSDPGKLHAILTNPAKHPQVELQPRIDEHPEQTQAKTTIMARPRNRPSTNPLGATVDEQIEDIADFLANDWMLNEYHCSLEQYTDHNLDLLEAKKSDPQIGPNTSNYTLGKLKNRRDSVGHAAREELARRYKEKLTKGAAGGILRDHLTGSKVHPDKLAAAGEVLQDASGRTISRHINAAIEDHQDKQQRKRVKQSIINQAQYRKRKKAAEEAKRAEQQQTAEHIDRLHQAVAKAREQDGYNADPWNYASGTIHSNHRLLTKHFVDNHRTIINKMKSLDVLSKQLGSDHPRTTKQVSKFLQDHIVHIGRIANMHEVPGIRHSAANLKVMSGPTAQLAKARIDASYKDINQHRHRRHTNAELERLAKLDAAVGTPVPVQQPIARPIRRSDIEGRGPQLADSDLGLHPDQNKAPEDPFGHASHPADASKVASIAKRISSLFSIKKEVGPEDKSR